MQCFAQKVQKIRRLSIELSNHRKIHFRERESKQEYIQFRFSSNATRQDRKHSWFARTIYMSL